MVFIRRQNGYSSLIWVFLVAITILCLSVSDKPMNATVIRANSVALQEAKADEIKIKSAVFGEGRARTVCTDRIQELVADPNLVVTVNTNGLRVKNRTGAFRAFLVIQFEVNGVSGELTLKNKERVNLRHAIINKATELGLPNDKTPPMSTATAAPNNAPVPESAVNLVMPAKIERLRGGDSGRILLLHLPERDTLAIVDLVQRKIVKNLPVPDEARFAANATSLFIALPKDNQLQRWNLKSFEREKLGFMDRDFPADDLIMGCAGIGPLGVLSKGKLTLWDPETLEKLNYPEDQLLSGPEMYDYRVSVSADGKTFCGKTNGISSQPFQFMRINDGGLERADSGGHSMNEAWCLPSADGDFAFRYGEEKVYSYDLKEMVVGEYSEADLHPTTDPRYALVFRVVEDKTHVSICQIPSFTRMWHVNDLPSIGDGDISTLTGRIHQEPKVRYLPDDGILACILADDKTVHIVPFHLEEKLASTGKPYLQLNSKPRSWIYRAETFEYQIDVLSSSEVEYKLDAGPSGLTVSPTGLVTWNSTGGDPFVNVAISVTSKDGLQLSHSFEIMLKDKVRTMIAGSPGNDAHIGDANGAGQQADEVTIRVPGTIGAICSAGGGRYLVAESKADKKLFVVDAVNMNIAFEIPMEDSDLFCGSQDFVYVFSKEKQELQQWSLEQKKSKRSQRLNFSVPPDRMNSGSGGSGPIGFCCGDHAVFLDTQTMKWLPVKDEEENDFRIQQPQMSVSADGKFFCFWSYSTFHRFFQQGQAMIGERMSANPRWVQPSGNGSLLLAGDVVYDFNMKPFDLPRFDNFVVLPTDDARFLLRIAYNDRKSSLVTVLAADATTELSSPLEVPLLTDGWGRMDGKVRVQLLKDPGRIVIVPEANDRVMVLKHEIGNAISSDRIFIVSQPPVGVTLTEPLQYKVDVLTEAEVEYKILEGPEGMKIDADGLVTWTPKERPVGGAAHVKLAVKRKGNAEANGATVSTDEVTQDFSLRVTRSLAEDSSKLPIIVRKENVFFDVVEGLTELPDEIRFATRGSQGKLLILSGDYFAIVNEQGTSFDKTVKVGKMFSQIIERDNGYLAIQMDPPVIRLLDKSSLKIKKEANFGRGRLLEITPHPKLDVSYITMQIGGGLPNYRFLQFDERKFEGREVEEGIGQNLAIDPSGKYLYSGYADTYQKGQELLINPDRIHVVPTFGSLSWLLRYELKRNGEPTLAEIKENVGASPRGLIVLSNGDLALLSPRGHNGSIPMFDGKDLKTLPKQLLGVASPENLDVHPFSPIAVSCSQTDLSLVNLAGNADLSKAFAGMQRFPETNYRQAWFSGDGKSTLISIQIGEVNYLQVVKMQLPAGIERGIDKAWIDRDKVAEKSVDEITEENAIRVPLKDLESLRGGQVTDRLRPAEVAKNNTRSVVVISCSNSIGTGFAVGPEGYVLTCAHCVTDSESLRVWYKSAGGKMIECQAKVIAIDEEKDMALLKAAAKVKFIPVQLAVGEPLETGAEVTVIGHPGVGDESLSYSMTQGIISNAERKIDNVDMIQTSAAVNPGNSGGPMFDEFGRVIGMVVLKADIEGAGFAIAHDELAEFLMTASVSKGDEGALERQWYDDKGAGPLVGSLTGITSDGVSISRTSDGRTFKIPNSKLSDVDQKFLRLLRKSAK